MTPFEMILIVTWLIPNPAGMGTQAVIRETFSSKAECRAELNEDMAYYESIDAPIKLQGFCVRKRGRAT